MTSNSSVSVVKVQINMERSYNDIGSINRTRISIQNSKYKKGNITSDKWNQFLKGKQSIRLQIDGIFTNYTVEKFLNDIAYNNDASTYRICLADGRCIDSQFIIDAYEVTQEQRKMPAFNITLTSTGNITYTSSVATQ